MPEAFLLWFGLLVMAWALIARRAARWQLTAPIAFVAAGALLQQPLAGLLGADESGSPLLEPGAVKLLAEATLVVVLFHDATTVRLRQLRRDPVVPLRLLAIGFPLALLLTMVVAGLLLPELGLAGALLVAAALTPTDAGLGAQTVLNPVVPARVRRALNVESGLNDGLATPVVLIALAAVEQTEGGPPGNPVLQVGLVPLAIGAGVGILGGFVAARAVDASMVRELSTLRGRAVAVLMVPFVLFGASYLLEGNAFVAAFLGGLAFGRTAMCLEEEEETSETLELLADLLGYAIWFLAGVLVVGVLEDGLRWQWVVLAVLVLTVLRIGPVALAMVGSGFRRQTVLFLGWFGPRGLASIVFALLAVEELGLDNQVAVDAVGVITVTVLLSVLGHGVSAGPWANRYGRWARSADAPIEHEPGAEPMPGRSMSMPGDVPADPAGEAEQGGPS